MKLIYHTSLLLVTLLATLTGCTKNPLSDIFGSTSKELTEKSIISDISMDADSKATGTPMAVGSTFRLYAMAKGKTSMQDVLTTRTYTIATTAGVPVLDADQKELYLPVGDVDIYLVGPVVADVLDDGGTTLTKINIATELGVFPHYGADLIASKTTVKVVAGGVNKFQLNPLTHKMARMDVDVSRLPEAKYENLEVREIKIYKQSLSSDFVFGEDGGSINSSVGENDITVKGLSINEVNKGNHYTATLYMIPRPLAEMKIEVNFTCNLIGSVEKIDKRLESGLIQASLVGGKQNRFWSNPVLSPNILWRTKVLPWNDVDLGEIPISKDEDLVFSYSGADAPITINGEKYWADRSGNGRHAKIVGDIRYDAANKFYASALTGTSYFQVPDLGYMSDYTIEVTLESDRDPKNAIVSFKDPGVNDRCLSIHIPWTENTVYFDTGGVTDGQNRMSYQFHVRDLALFKNFSTYYFTRNSAKQTIIGCNGAAFNTNTMTQNYGAFRDNRLLECVVDNSVSSKQRLNMRLYSVRMYKKVITPEIAQRHYEADLATYCAINTKGDNSEYIQNGLILNLDAKDRGTSSTDKFWEDRSGNGNHAKFYGDAGYYSNSYYRFLGNVNGYAKLLKSLGRLQNYTVEFVVKADSPPMSTSFLYFSPVDVSGPRVLNVHYPWYNELYFDSPWNVGGMTNVRNKIQVYNSSLTPRMPYDIYEINQCNISREYNKEDGFSVSMNGIHVTSTSTYSQLLPEMRHCFIGREGNNGIYPFKGRLYALRVYNRVLTPQEKQHNYLVDKNKFAVLWY